MKYFSNINNAEELRKAYRQHVINMHPDRGGNEEEFKAMQAEFETLKKQYQNGTRREQYTHQETAEERARRQAEEQREREEWARWEAEERARREQEEREKADRIRKAQEENRAAVRAWAEILERVSVDKTGEKARFYRFTDKKEAAAFVAATKRNITRVINHYFPGLKVKVTISGEIWKEKFIISWEDGPSEKQLRDTCKELAFFIPASYCCAGPGEDYGHHEERHSTAPWREAYGQALGDVDDFETARTLSEEGKQQAEDMAARYFANFDPKSDAPKFAANLQELINFAKAANFYDTYKITDTFRQLTGNYYGDMYGNCESITGEVSRRQLAEMLADHVAVTISEGDKAARRAAQFCPHYGKALKSLQQLTGVGTTNDGDPVCFFCNTDRNSRRRLTIAEAVERLERGEAVSFGTEHTGADGDKWYWGKFAGGYKTQDKRAAKFAAAGLTIKGHTGPNSFVTLHGIAPEFAAAIREDLADIDRQREAWEAKQTATEGTQTAQERTTAAKTADTPTTDTTTATERVGLITNPAAAGLRLEEIPGGVAVVGTADNEKARSRQTYKARKSIKAHGATWNREANRWEATDPEAVAQLRQWFEPLEEPKHATNDDEPQADTLEQAGEITDTAQDEPEALRGATLQEIERHSDRTNAPAWLKPGQTFKRTTADGREVVAICTRILLDGFAYITANGCGVADHVTAFAAFDFDGVTPCDIDDKAPEFARMLRNFQRIRTDFEQWQAAHPYEPTATAQDEPQADTLENGQDITDTTDEPTATAQDEPQAAQSEPTANEPTADQSGDLSPLMEAVADVLRIFADIMQQAKQWEGVTVPAATLQRWKQEANEGTKTAAARLCEVCACLASLTPDSRRDFDALGVIFWTLSEQLKNGYNPDTLQGATDYARAQLFDLIDRTQTANQADRLREVLNPDNNPRREAA